MMRGRLASLAAACGVAGALALTGCSSSTTSKAQPSANASSPSASAAGATTTGSASAVPAGSPSASPTAGDAAGLVAAMWAQLGAASQKQLCGIYATRGDEAGDIFVAGTQTDVKASVLTDKDKAAIAKAAGELLAKSCPA